MRILYASERPPYPFFLGGAARCAHQLLFNMANELRIECIAVGSRDYAVTAWHFPADGDFPSLGIKDSNPELNTLNCGYPVTLLPSFFDTLAALIDEFKPDVVWSQLEGGLDIMLLAQRKGVQGLYYVHDAEFNPAELKQIAQTGCHMVASSRFLADKAERAIGRSCHVIYPASELYFGTTGNPHGKITMINPVGVKGIDTMLEIARLMPEHEFMLQESWKLGDKALADLQAKLAVLPNVQFQHRVSDMRAVYGNTRLLLAPSKWEEGFGMIAPEAQSCRVPVIASRRGGLPESVGDGGILIDDYLNPQAWVTAIRDILADDETYGAWQARAHRHASSDDMHPHTLAKRLADICTLPAPGVAGPIRRTIQNLPIIGGLFR